MVDPALVRSPIAQKTAANKVNTSLHQQQASVIIKLTEAFSNRLWISVEVPRQHILGIDRLAMKTKPIRVFLESFTIY